jgi:hypothetical protein
MEVCCLSSTATDFTAYGWTIAKDYAFKVEEEVEQKLASWPDMQSGVRTATLVLAQMDFPRPVPKVPWVDNKTKPKESEKKDICTSFNRCTTEGKCEYEVSNPDKTCIRKHGCNWCRTNLRQSCKHQAWKCRRRESSGGNN